MNTTVKTLEEGMEMYLLAILERLDFIKCKIKLNGT